MDKKITIESSKRFDTKEEADNYISESAKKYIKFCKLTRSNPTDSRSFRAFKMMYPEFSDLNLVFN